MSNCCNRCGKPQRCLADSSLPNALTEGFASCSCIPLYDRPLYWTIELGVSEPPEVASTEVICSCFFHKETNTLADGFRIEGYTCDMLSGTYILSSLNLLNWKYSEIEVVKNCSRNVLQKIINIQLTCSFGAGSSIDDIKLRSGINVQIELSQIPLWDSRCNEGCGGFLANIQPIYHYTMPGLIPLNISGPNKLYEVNPMSQLQNDICILPSVIEVTPHYE